MIRALPVLNPVVTVTVLILAFVPAKLVAVNVDVPGLYVSEEFTYACKFPVV